MVCAMNKPPQIHASSDAVAFIVRNGGRLFVWADESDMKHVKFHPPDTQIEFKQLPCDLFEFNVDTTIAEAAWWKVVLHHFPHRYVDAEWDAWMPAVWGGAISRAAPPPEPA
jgi:hypothetical protein